MAFVGKLVYFVVVCGCARTFLCTDRDILPRIINYSIMMVIHFLYLVCAHGCVRVGKLCAPHSAQHPCATQNLSLAAYIVLRRITAMHPKTPPF